MLSTEGGDTVGEERGTTVAPREMHDRIEDLRHGDVITCDFCGRLVPRSAAEMVNREETDPDLDIDEIWVWACHACRIDAERRHGPDGLEVVEDRADAETVLRW